MNLFGCDGPVVCVFSVVIGVRDGLPDLSLVTGWFSTIFLVELLKKVVFFVFFFVIIVGVLSLNSVMSVDYI